MKIKIKPTVKTSNAQYNCSPSTDQCPTLITKVWSMSLLGNFPQLIYWEWHSLSWNILWSSLGHYSCFLCSSSLPEYESKHLIQSKHYLAATKTSVCFQHYSHTKSKGQHCTSCSEEIHCIPAQTRTMYDVTVMNCRLKSQSFLCLWCRSGCILAQSAPGVSWEFLYEIGF